MNSVACIITSGLSITAFIISFFQFKEKGFLFNNAYIHASKSERKSMNKKPHYRQSAIVFLLIAISFFISSIEIILTTKCLSYVAMFTMIVVIFYAIASSIYIARKYK